MSADDLLPSTFSALPPVLQHHIIWAANGSLAARRVNREVLELHDRAMQRTAKLLPPRDVLSRVPSSIVKRVLLERWPALENLSLQKAEIDDETVALLLGERPQLRSLNLDRCSGLTMATLQLLHSLSSSSSSSSPSLSDDGDGADEGKADAGSTTARSSSRLEAWQARGCFWTPCRLLSPTDVVINQLYALQENSDEGIAKCFAFASPENRMVTGPIDKFARMIRGGFAYMTRFTKGYVRDLALTGGGDDRFFGPPETTRLFHVVLMLCGTCAGFVNTAQQPDVVQSECMWILQQQTGSGETTGPAGSWMTTGVQPLKKNVVWSSEDKYWGQAGPRAGKEAYEAI